jgi:hypothetical protein
MSTIWAWVLLAAVLVLVLCDACRRWLIGDGGGLGLEFM